MKMVTDKGIVREGFLNYKTFLKKLCFFTIFISENRDKITLRQNFAF